MTSNFAPLRILYRCSLDRKHAHVAGISRVERAVPVWRIAATARWSVGVCAASVVSGRGQPGKPAVGRSPCAGSAPAVSPVSGGRVASGASRLCLRPLVVVSRPAPVVSVSARCVHWSHTPAWCQSGRGQDAALTRPSVSLADSARAVDKYCTLDSVAGHC